MPESTVATTVITGAAGGVGAQTARDLLEDPHVRCELVDIEERPSALNTLPESETRWRYWQCDVADHDAVQALCERLRADGLRITGLVNAAGNHETCPTATVSRSEFLSVFEVHVLGSLYFSQGLFKSIESAGGGSIVNVSSVASAIGVPGRAAYGASKAAIESLTRTLAVEWASSGIRVNAVSFGYLDTPMGKKGVKDLAAVGRLHAIGRIAAPREASNVIRFLISEASSFVTGSVISADGGFLISKGV
jgi:NAD(P)-dependent dehydrogenase (short-subunit alcohol dehydrogenase family)